MQDAYMIIRPAANGFLVEVPSEDDDDEFDVHVFTEIESALEFIRERCQGSRR